MRKATKITYNPFENTVDIMITTDAANPEWENLASNSELLTYTNSAMKVLFTNIAEDVVTVINEKQNSSEDGLEIQFYGPASDYKILEEMVAREKSSHPDKGELSCVHLGEYYSADESIRIVKNAYSRISDEFNDYLPNNPKYDASEDSIGNRIIKFNEIISNEIPICIIGNYSVGKSAFINALIGSEILPSKVDPSTAKNVKVIRSTDGNYYLKLSFRSEGFEATSHFEYEIKSYGLSLLSMEGPEADKADDLINEITEAISNPSVYPKEMARRSKSEILHDVLDVMNNTENQGLLANVRWNLVITVPFVESALTKTDSTIVFYDTPGSNNATLNQAEHKKALEELMAAQTNALPILMTTKENAASNDVSEIKNLLDEYSYNFSSPNCLVVLAKGDLLVSGQLHEPIPTPLTTWHGKSPVLYTTQIGAIGLRKTNKEEWIDEVYKEAFKAWMNKYRDDPETYSLPEYNIVPCPGRDIIDAAKISSHELYSTGIPSVECEILYYIDHYANYKKAIRGRESLLGALYSIQDELDEKKKEFNEASKLAKIKKEEEKVRLIDELGRIKVGDLTNETDAVASEFADRLNDYIDGLPAVLNEIYESVDKDSPLTMDQAFNDLLRAHCQKNLIDASYYGENGIQSLIFAKSRKYADKYMNALEQFVTSNSSSLSEESRESIGNYLSSEVKPPEFHEIKSILDDLNEWLGKTALVQYGFISLTVDEETAKELWLDNKRKSFEKRLRDSKSILNMVNYGLFKRTAIYEPLTEYSRQLQEWAHEYYNHIKERLDAENAVLSGMEDNIRKINDSINDIVERLANVQDARDRLLYFTDLKEKE